jgi:hypothetical protein
LGQDNEAVLREVSYSAEAIAALREAGVIWNPHQPLWMGLHSNTAPGSLQRGIDMD